MQSLNNHVNGWAGFIKSTFGLSEFMTLLLFVTLIMLMGLLLIFVLRPILFHIVEKISNRNEAVWMRLFNQCGVFHRIIWLLFGLFSLVIVPVLTEFDFPITDLFAKALEKVIELYIVGMVAAIFSAFLNAIELRFRMYKVAQKISIKSYIQVIKIILFSLTAIVMVSIVISQSPMYLLTGLGAMTAVGMLIFKDSILGFVASVQLSTNDVLRIGDWVEIPKYGIDGVVMDISLNTIKVQNFDRTIVTIPSYAVLTDAVKNWRGMSESGGRRIKRSFTIDVCSVKLCDADLLARLLTLPKLDDKFKAYLSDKMHHIDETAINLMGADKRGVTNLTLFRLYLDTYLSMHPGINATQTFLVRELQNDNYGIPIELYMFAKVTDWFIYESIQSDIFDFIYAVIPLFELRAFQYQSEGTK